MTDGFYRNNQALQVVTILTLFLMLASFPAWWYGMRLISWAVMVIIIFAIALILSLMWELMDPTVPQL